LWGVIALLTALSFVCPASAQENRDTPIEDKLLSIVNQARANASLPPLAGDKRLNDAAAMHAVEFVKKGQIAHQFEGEPSLLDRLRLAQAPCASAGEIMLIAADLEHVPEQLMRSETFKQVLLNPKYSMAGFAAVQSGSQLFIVANLARPFRSLTMDEVESLIADAVQRSRADNKLVPFKVIPMRQLRGVTCDMAKKDSLKVQPVNPYVGYIGAPSQDVRNFVFTTFDPGTLPANVHTAGDDPKINAMSVGACFGNSPTYPAGTYWIYLIFYRK
jgi:hypothetical protein